MKKRNTANRIILKITILSLFTACIGFSSGCSCSGNVDVSPTPVVSAAPSVATPTDAPTATVVPSEAPDDTPVTPTSTLASVTPSPTSTPTNTPVPTDTPAPTDTPTPTCTPTPTSTPTPTNTPTPTSTPTPLPPSEVLEAFTSLDDVPVPGMFETTDITSTYKIVMPNFYDKVEFKVDGSAIKSLYTSSDSEDIAIDIVYTLNTEVKVLYNGYPLKRPDEIVLEERTEGQFIHTEALNIEIDGSIVGLEKGQAIPAVMSVIYTHYGVGTDFPVPAVHFYIYKK